MLDLKHPSKVKNDKIQRWLLELSPYDFSAIYRPDNKNDAADTFSRAISVSVVSASVSLKSLDDSLSHPGITRMWALCENEKPSLLVRRSKNNGEIM